MLLGDTGVNTVCLCTSGSLPGEPCLKSECRSVGVKEEEGQLLSQQEHTDGQGLAHSRAGVALQRGEGLQQPLA